MLSLVVLDLASHPTKQFAVILREQLLPVRFATRSEATVHLGGLIAEPLDGADRSPAWRRVRVVEMLAEGFCAQKIADTLEMTVQNVYRITKEEKQRATQAESATGTLDDRPYGVSDSLSGE